MSGRYNLCISLRRRTVRRYDHMVIVPPEGYSGGLAVFWKEYVSVSCISSDVRLVDLHVQFKAFQFYLSCIYGHPNPKHRHHLWERLQRLAITRTGAWMICGDCNEITTPDEKKGGRVCTANSLYNFNTMIQVCGMEDLRFKGNQLSWVGRRRKEIIECCLDRVLVNSEWKRNYPASENEYLDLAESDHRPMIVSIDYQSRIKKGWFRYDKRLFNNEDFVDTISEAWSQTRIMSRWKSKLDHCRHMMIQWKCEHQTSSAVKIQVIRVQIDKSVRDNLVTMETIQSLRVQLNKAYQEEEEYWRLKSRNRWLNLGDRNTPFYHGVAKMKKKQNMIKGLFDRNGILHSKDETIAKIAEEYFLEMFSHSDTRSLQDVLPSIPIKVTEEMNRFLTRAVSDVEIKNALFLIGADRAPGPDGFTASFYHQFWDVISEDVCCMVRRFFETGEMEPNVNHTNIVLIPKFPEANTMGDFRPISLCSVAYNLISKVLCLRLQGCLDKIISDSQVAFVPQRQISDNILVAHELTHALKSKKDCSEQYMAIKTDISKAYDRVEWGFLETTMIMLGFDVGWIKLIMSCVRFVSYSVVINGIPYGSFKPTRGLRQGDALSPYLFLLCAEVMSQMLDSAQRQGLFEGMKLSRNSPVVSHLLFADDSLFFCKANVGDAKCMAQILKQYEEVSGQKVNLGKSSIIFGVKIDHTVRNHIHHILQIESVGGSGKYLGLPEQLGRSKVAELEGVVDQIRAQLKPWYNKYLSPAGKEILIKSVLQAKPVYPMSCFLLPKTTCDEINSLLSEFWWGHNGDKRKIPWIAWDKLCLPKNEGGMGFRDLYKFNLALLAKQAWRIQQNPNSLLSRIYRGRYNYSTTFLQASNRNNTSYGFRSIQAGKNLLNKGVRMLIADGKDTSVWFDQWLPTLPPRKITNITGREDLMVADLICQQTKTWKLEVLENLFNPVDVEVIKNIKLSRFAGKDKLVWSYSKDLRYSVKSGYWAATHDLNEEEAVQSPLGSIDLKNEVWNLPILPKIKQFLWNVISGAVSSYVGLCSRGIKIDPTCQRCCYEEETINHILFLCPHAVAIWRCSNSPLASRFTDNLESNIGLIFTLMKELKEDQSVCYQTLWTLWYVWKSRNEFLFQKRNVHPIEDVRRAKDANDEWIQNVQVFKASSLRVERSSAWEPPPFGWLKCNVDCSFKAGDDYNGIGWIVRDHQGKMMLAGGAKLQGITSILEGETQAFICAMQQVWFRGWRQVWFETDNQQLVGIVNGYQDNMELGSLAFDIRHWISLLPLCSLDYTNRERNQAADCIAKKVVSQFDLFVIYNMPPSWLFDSLYPPYTV